MTRQSCFVICAIGPLGSETRQRADNLFRHVITPVLRSKFDVTRADRLTAPGLITRQVIQLVIESDLVVADLTGRNPNVYYELALRHTLRRPCVQLIDAGEQLPFDIADTRTIEFDIADLTSVDECKKALVHHISTSMAAGVDGSVESPISVAVDLLELRKSSNPLEHGAAEILDLLGELRSEMKLLRSSVGDGEEPLIESATQEDDFLTLRRVMRELAKSGELRPEAFRAMSRGIAESAPSLSSWLDSMATRALAARQVSRTSKDTEVAPGESVG